MSEWIEWNDRPSDDSTVEVEYRDCIRHFGAAAIFDWSITGGPRDIVRFRVIATPKRHPEERLSDIERRIEELERKQSVRVVAPAPVWVNPAYTVGEEHPSVQGIVPPIV